MGKVGTYGQLKKYKEQLGIESFPKNGDRVGDL